MTKRGLNRAILDSIEDKMCVLGFKEGIGNGSERKRGPKCTTEMKECCGTQGSSYEAS